MEDGPLKYSWQPTGFKTLVRRVKTLMNRDMDFKICLFTEEGLILYEVSVNVSKEISD